MRSRGRHQCAKDVLAVMAVIRNPERLGGGTEEIAGRWRCRPRSARCSWRDQPSLDGDRSANSARCGPRLTSSPRRVSTFPQVFPLIEGSEPLVVSAAATSSSSSGTVARRRDADNPTTNGSQRDPGVVPAASSRRTGNRHQREPGRDHADDAGALGQAEIFRFAEMSYLFQPSRSVGCCERNPSGPSPTFVAEPERH